MSDFDVIVTALGCLAALALTYGFILLLTGSQEWTCGVRPGQKFKANGAPSGNGGKAAPKADGPKADGTVPGA